MSMFRSALTVSVEQGRALLPSVLAAVVVPFGLGGQEADSPARGFVAGEVKTAEHGAPLAGVTVEIAGTRIKTLTDQHGHYGLTNVPAGTVSIQFHRIGYGRYTEEVRIEPGDRIELAVALTAEPIALNPILVLQTRMRMVGADPHVPGAAHYLSRSAISAMNLAFDDMHDFLRKVPGVNVSEEDGYGLRPNIGIRGTGAERSAKITLMEDGVLIAPAPYSAPAAYYFPVAGRMQAIEVRKGSSQIRYGPSTIGGAINFISTGIPDEFDWSLDLAGGGAATFKGIGRAGGSGEHLGWMVETYQIGTDGYKRLPQGGDTGFRVGDYVAKVRLNSRRDATVYQQVEIKVGYTDEVSNETYLGLRDDDFRRDALQRYAASEPDIMDAEHSQVQIRHFLRPGRHLDFTTTLYRNSFARNWYKLQSVLGTSISSVLGDADSHRAAFDILRGAESGPDALAVRANNREYLSQGLQFVAGLFLETGAMIHDIELGARVHRDEEDRFQWEDGYRMTAQRMVLTSEGAPGSQANRVGEASALALHLQDQIEIGKWLVVPGVRFEDIDFRRTDYAGDDPDRSAPTRVRENTIAAWIPGVGVSVEATPSSHLYGGIHRGFAAGGPGADERTEAERSINYELGAQVRMPSMTAQATGFFTDYENILGRATLATGESGAGDLFNGGQVGIVGLELSVELDPHFGARSSVRTPVGVSYTFTRAEFRTDFESDYSAWGEVSRNDRLPYLPEHRYAASLAVEGDRWSVGFDLWGSAAARARAGQGPIPGNERIDRFVVLNLTGEYRMSNRVLYLGIRNLADTRYVAARRPAGARPGLPRTFAVGIRQSR